MPHQRLLFNLKARGSRDGVIKVNRNELDTKMNDFNATKSRRWDGFKLDPTVESHK